MIRLVSSLALLVAGMGVTVGTAHAASFDCSKATTPFERAICGDADLSAADERLALTYQTAVGGLSKMASEEMRTGQREWLAYAQRACTRDAKPMTSGAYDERGIFCLNQIFNDRSTVLEQSRIISGIRFYPKSQYEAVPDPYESDNEDSWYPVAQHELSWVEIDADIGYAHAFNDTVRAEALSLATTINPDAAEDDESDVSTSDTTNTFSVETASARSSITLKERTSWYGHGAAHGNWGMFYRHYLIEPGRFLEASDIFAGDGWEKALLDLTLVAAEAQHGDNLMIDGDTSYLADIVADPRRWDLSDPYALVIQFLPYEISAYAYGGPTVRVRWEDMEDYAAENAEATRFGL